MNIEIPSFSSKNDLFSWLVQNKSALINQKKSAIKHSDGISFAFNPSVDKETSSKAAAIAADPTKLFVRSVINTTKLMDSHMDVHINGLWKKSIAESKDKYLIQEHQFNFKGIISDEVTAMTRTMNWNTLGFNFDGTTEALIYDSILHKDRNPYMFDQYAKGRVKNHSVGMRYIKMFMCVNSPLWQEEKENWDKYIDMVANREVAEESGFFWAITEAKDIEGSAVILGSNYATPTLRVEEQKTEPLPSTQTEPSKKDTRLIEAINKLKTQI